MILFIHSFQVLNTLSSMVLTAVNADVGGHFNLVIGLLVFRRRRVDTGCWIPEGWIPGYRTWDGHRGFRTSGVVDDQLQLLI